MNLNNDLSDVTYTYPSKRGFAIRSNVNQRICNPHPGRRDLLIGIINPNNKRAGIANPSDLWRLSPSESDIKGLFADFDTTSRRLGNTVEAKNSRLAAVLKGVEELNFGNFEDHQIDLFGDAYEFLISNYAANAGKSGYEFFYTATRIQAPDLSGLPSPDEPTHTTKTCKRSRPVSR